MKRRAPEDGLAGAGAGGAKQTRPEVLSALMQDEHTGRQRVAQYAAQFSAGRPFPHLRLRNVFDEDLLRAVKADLLATPFTPKNNDLYTFRQSPDLRQLRSEAVARLRRLLYGTEFRRWMSSVTGVELDDTVDMSSAVYGDGDHLLCHDDDLSSRRVAYILYLVPPRWAPADGGSLDLYASDEAGLPTHVVTRLFPEWNSLAFFAVDELSHHQVAEVLSAAKGPRLSISGWFHGDSVPRRPVPPPPRPPSFAPLDNGTDITHWISLRYLHPDTVAQVRSQFRQTCSLELPGFLHEEAYQRVVRACMAQRWQHVGPANMQHYKRSPAAMCLCDARGAGAAAGAATATVAEEVSEGAAVAAAVMAAATASSVRAANNTIPDALAELIAFVCGTQFAQYVAALTGLLPTALEPEARCFGHADYTMISDPAVKAQRAAAKQARLARKSEEGNGDEAKVGGGSGSGSGGEGEAKGEDEGEDEGRTLDICLSLLPPWLPVAKPAVEGADKAGMDVDAESVGKEEEEGGADDPSEAGPWHVRFGGYTSYLAEDEELLTVVPKANTFSLVLREASVMSFVKFVNHHAPCPRYDVFLAAAVEMAEDYADEEEEREEGEEEEEGVAEEEGERDE